MSADPLQLYADLGVRPVINALGARTVLGGSEFTPRSSKRYSWPTLLRRYGRALYPLGRGNSRYDRAHQPPQRRPAVPQRSCWERPPA